MTVAEMRKNPERIEDIPQKGGGSRFDESTHPPLALKYFPKNGRILECGPVFGMFTKFLQDNGYEDIHVLDFVDILHFPDKSKITFKEIDFNFETIPYQDNFFNGIAAWGIGEHLENPFYFIRETYRVLDKKNGVFLFSLPNVFHIMSRLVFLKNGSFPRWNTLNNHISILPRGIIEKTVFRYFDVLEIKYIKPGIHVRFLNVFAKWLPANEWFGDYVVYVLKPKSS